MSLKCGEFMSPGDVNEFPFITLDGAPKYVKYFF